MKKYLLIKKKRVLIQPGERRRNQLTNKSNEQSEKYSPLWKSSKLFIPPQSEGMIGFSFNIGLLRVQSNFQVTKNKSHTKVKRLFEKQTFTPCAFHSVLVRTLSMTNKQTVEHSQHAEKPALSLR